MDDKQFENILKAGLGTAVKTDSCDRYFDDIKGLVEEKYLGEYSYKNDKAEVKEHISDCAYCTGQYLEFKLFIKQCIEETEKEDIGEMFQGITEKFVNFKRNISDSINSYINSIINPLPMRLAMQHRSATDTGTTSKSISISGIDVLYDYVTLNRVGCVKFFVDKPYKVLCFYNDDQLEEISENVFPFDLSSDDQILDLRGKAIQAGIENDIIVIKFTD